MTGTSTRQLIRHPITEVYRQIRCVGVDGCKAGWIAVFSKRGRLAFIVVPTVRDIAYAFPDAELICIDIPIGLPWAECPVRTCDRLTRALLGRVRRSSVFPVPCREAVHAATAADARKRNLATLGVSISAQLMGIRGKIAEVDAFLSSTPEARSIFHEAHPELAFWALAGQSSMMNGKKTSSGLDDRMALLNVYMPDVSQLAGQLRQTHARTQVGTDDLVDAAVLCLVARAPRRAIRVVSSHPAVDEFGLRMEMVYAVPYAR